MDKIEWWDVCRIALPDVTWDEFEHLWDVFMELKRIRARFSMLH